MREHQNPQEYVHYTVHGTLLLACSLILLTESKVCHLQASRESCKVGM